MSKSVDAEFLDREEWRRWLEKNHSSEKEVWMVIQKKKSKNKGLRYQEAVEEAICFGWITVKCKE